MRAEPRGCQIRVIKSTRLQIATFKLFGIIERCAPNVLRRELLAHESRLPVVAFRSWAAQPSIRLMETANRRWAVPLVTAVAENSQIFLTLVVHRHYALRKSLLLHSHSR